MTASQTTQELAHVQAYMVIDGVLKSSDIFDVNTPDFREAVDDGNGLEFLAYLLDVPTDVVQDAQTALERELAEIAVIGWEGNPIQTLDKVYEMSLFQVNNGTSMLNTVILQGVLYRTGVISHLEDLTADQIVREATFRVDLELPGGVEMLTSRLTEVYGITKEAFDQAVLVTTVGLFTGKISPLEMFFTVEGDV